MAYGRCADCNQIGFIHKHHVSGRENSDTVVSLCPERHDKHHRGLLLWNTKLACQFSEWYFSQIRNDIFTTHEEITTKLDEMGYTRNLDEIDIDDWHGRPGSLLRVIP